MRTRIAGALAAIIVAAVAWLVLASMAIVAAFGFWPIYPWPGKGWMWLLYFLEARDNPIVHKWLWITGISSAFPFLAIVGIATLVAKRNTKQPSLYGEIKFADKGEMNANGIKTSRRLP